MQVIQDLKESGMYKNSLVLVTTDNGGEPWYSNLPLRGKVELYLKSVIGHSDQNTKLCSKAMMT